ncbi:hypothetical protein ACYBEL_24620 [Klebsiella pneumoniae]|uniref:hypothetical protein n=1 Tax=Klebsiella pneumoniae complex TaxID=3390273 RepID=UPI002072EEE7|nr:hypothetical protein [Klebsiella pneumoniae]MCM5820501.1 hypothetical protein [Klebsiella pneumoniae]MCS5985068.1 hypothetical protein [Klebsiella quasipneumoniae subsp. similipneumoniae]GKJ22468.1 hypothetical protein NUBL21979_40880 [Klebsiella pneumoniae]
MTDITELAQSHELLIANGQQTADLLRHLADNEIDSDYFAVVSECESYGQETEAELSITEFALRAAGYVDELVEALEKAQTKAIEQGRTACELFDEVTALRHRIAELDSRTVKLSPELYTIGELIRTQDNRITDQPMFVVFQKREIIGSDEHSPSRICWVWDGEEVSELRAKRLEALYQDGRDTRGYDRYTMQEVDEFVTACFTEHGCKDYLRQNGHNLRLPYIYACGSFRNNEYQLVRNWLAGIKVEAE